MVKPIHIISVPYDSGHFNKRMGAGPLKIINSGLIRRLRSRAHQVVYKEISQHDELITEIASTFSLLKMVKETVADTLTNGGFPLVLAGNCSTSTGVMAALNASETGVLWFDAHADCETPDTTKTGFLDGMALSLLTNRCWKNLLAVHELDTGVTGQQVALVGARDMSEEEMEFTRLNQIQTITVDAIRNLQQDGLKELFTTFLQPRFKQLHLHIDIDVLDPQVAVANAYQVKNGLVKQQLFDSINYCANIVPLASLTISAYDPSYDPDAQVIDLIKDLVVFIADRIR